MRHLENSLENIPSAILKCFFIFSARHQNLIKSVFDKLCPVFYNSLNQTLLCRGSYKRALLDAGEQSNC